MTLDQNARALITRLNKKHGDGSVYVASEQARAAPYTTGSLNLDLILGGGWPGNQWSEIVGVESSGKTSIAHKTVAANQAADPDFTCLWVAAEHYDKPWAQRLGVDPSRVIVYATQSMEAAFQVMCDATAEGCVDAIVLDSYPALIADEEAAKAVGERTVGLGARTVGQFFRKVAPAGKRNAGERNFFGLFINQYRADIGGWAPHGTPKTTPGGQAKNYSFYSRVEIHRKGFIEVPDGEGKKMAVGQTIQLHTIKNKAARPRQVRTLDFYFEDCHPFSCGDYDLAQEVLTTGVALSVIEKGGGGYYTLPTGERFKGQDAAATALRSEPALMAATRADIAAAWKSWVN